MKAAIELHGSMPLRVEKPVYGGDCLAHIDASGARPGKTIFVPLTLPGERIEAGLVEQKRSFARAEATSILEASPQRIAPGCPHYGVCGGCHYQHADYAAQLQWKEQILREALARAGVAAPARIEVLAGEPWAYRNRVRMALTDSGELAYRARRSHGLVPIRACPIAAPLLVETAERTSEFLRRNPIGPRVRELELFANHDQTQLLLTLIAEHPPQKTEWASEAWLSWLHSSLPAPTIGIHIESQDDGINPTPTASHGASSLTYIAAGVPYRVDHGAFFQVNRSLLDDFVALLCGNAGETALAWDLYAGVGLFARQLTERCGEVHAVEAAPASTAALRHNLLEQRAQVFATTTLEYLRGNRERREPRPGLILLDPPRAGLGPEVTQLLNAIHAPEMVYVSCDPMTLARDLRALTQERFHIEAITLVDMFPQTFHIETVARLRRS